MNSKNPSLFFQIPIKSPFRPRILKYIVSNPSQPKPPKNPIQQSYSTVSESSRISLDILDWESFGQDPVKLKLYWILISLTTYCLSYDTKIKTSHIRSCNFVSFRIEDFGIWSRKIRVNSIARAVHVERMDPYLPK